MLLNVAPYQGLFTRLLQLRPRVECFAEIYNGRRKRVLSLEGECTWRGYVLEVAALQFVWCSLRQRQAAPQPRTILYAPATSNSKVPRLLLPPTTHHPPIPTSTSTLRCHCDLCATVQRPPPCRLRRCFFGFSSLALTRARAGSTTTNASDAPTLSPPDLPSL